jgi:hypothetical protein
MSIVIDGTGTISGINASNGLSSPQTGSVLQVVNATYATQVATTGATFIDTGLTATITPKFSTSKIFVLTSAIWYSYRTANVTGGATQLVRNSTAIWTGSDNSYYTSVTGGTATEMINNYFNQIVDTPATTSATTYKLQFKSVGGANSAFNWNGSGSTNTSIITLMEIAG